MKVVEVIADVLKKEGVEFLACFPETQVMEAAAAVGIRPIVCRQERVGVGIADGFSRVVNGRRIGAFTMQLGPGAENAFAGVATAYSDSSPILVLPTGHSRSRSQVFPLFSSVRSFAAVTKSAETINVPDQVVEVMRRAFGQLKVGRFGPVLVEIPVDVLQAEVDGRVPQYEVIQGARSAGDQDAIMAAAKALLKASRPVILAGQGVLYAQACDELRQLAELLQVPVMTTIEGKSAFSERHPLSLGASAVTTTGPVVEFLKNADLVFAVGTSLTRHGLHIDIPPGKRIIHVTNDGRDLQKDYRSDYPILGDARLVLLQMANAVAGLAGVAGRKGDDSTTKEVSRARGSWLREWMPVLTSDEVPITPYRIIWEFMESVEPQSAIVTHDSGRPRDQLVPFYVAVEPRGYLGWGKSHALGTGIGLIMGAKLAAPNKFCVNFMGDAAFGMTGLDFETAVRCGIPITTIVLNNSTMATEKDDMLVSHERFGTRNLHGNYAEVGRAMGGIAERIERPEDISPAIARAMRHNAEGKSVLLEFITSEETRVSHLLPFSG